MLLEELVAAIDTVKSRIALHQSSLRQSEALTRYSLIDPLLRALGWDTADPALVTPEYDVGGKRADYALLEGNQVVVFLEAKRLDENLAGHRSQVAAYASELGIKYPALTNGSEWEVYDNSKLVPIDQRRILTVSIANSPTAATALQLLLLWRPNLASGQPVAANQPLAGLDQQSSAQPDPHTSIQGDPSETSLSESQSHSDAPSAGWVTLSAYSQPAGTPHPPAIRFPDSGEYSIQHWYEILTATVEWLVIKGLLTKDEIPFKTTTGRYLVNTEPIGADGNQFANHHTVLDGSLAVNTNLNAGQVRSNAKRLLEHFGQDPSSVLLKIE